jgi:hypothetical protein
MLDPHEDPPIDGEIRHQVAVIFAGGGGHCQALWKENVGRACQPEPGRIRVQPFAHLALVRSTAE